MIFNFLFNARERKSVECQKKRSATVSMVGYPVGLFTIIIYKKECVSDRMGQNVRVEDF